MIVTCEKCQAKQKVSDRADGQDIECLSCGHRFRAREQGIPAESGPRQSRGRRRKRKRNSGGKNPRGSARQRVPWSAILGSAFEGELFQATLKAAGPVLLFGLVYPVLVFVGTLLAVFSPPMRLLLYLIVFGGPLWLQGFMLRWHLGVIHRYAGNAREIHSYDVSILQAVLFLLITGGIALALFFPTVVLPTKILLSAVLPETAPAGADWVFAWIAGATFVFVYFQMACGVYAITGDQNPAVVVSWLWNSLPGLFGLYGISTVFVMTSSLVLYVCVLLFVAITTAVGKSLGVVEISLIFLESCIAVVCAVIMSCYLNLAPFAMFGKFLKRYRQRLGYDIR